MSSEFSVQGSTGCAEACRKRDQAESCITMFAGQSFRDNSANKLYMRFFQNFISHAELHMYVFAYVEFERFAANRSKRNC